LGMLKTKYMDYQNLFKTVVYGVYLID